MRPQPLVLLAVPACCAGCGGTSAQPKDDPSAFAVRVDQIVHNRYSAAWSDLHPARR